MQADEATTAAVERVVRRVLDGYEAGDIDALTGMLVDDPGLLLIGTAADEIRRGPAEARTQLERDLAQSEARTLSIDWTSVSASGDVAWLAAGVTANVTAGGQDLHFPLRLTLVLVRGGGDWKLAQAHFSTPDASTPEGRSYPEGTS